MTSLYERFAGTDDGARRLAVARLRREVLKALHRALKASNLSQVDLAERLGVRKSAVSQVLNGDGNVRITTLAEYLYATGHELTMAVVPAGQPRAEVLARRASVAIARRPYSTAEHASRNMAAHAIFSVRIGLTLFGPNSQVALSQRALAPRPDVPALRAPTQSALPQGADWSPLRFGDQLLGESGPVEAK